MTVLETPVGRFAPTPSGPLHFGSVVAAVASYLDVRAAGGRWLVRIDDVDRPRAQAGAGEAILASLARLGFEWDAPPVWQHQRDAAYVAALKRLMADGWVYGCACTRKMLADAPRAADGATLYPGTCRNGVPAGLAARAWRFRVPAGLTAFDDRVHGRIVEDVSQAAGDFVLHRADGLFAYQLAVVVDDAAAGVTDVVRGIDLMPSTARQICIARALGVAVPRYAHVPVVVDAGGQKLSKQSLARAIDAFPPALLIYDALVCLGQQPPAELADAPLPAVWDWALAHWSMARVPRQGEVRSRRIYDR
ncbi:MAG: tRNA glutamyl-Q(34) synthetase GluQRS [Rhodocyclaceae bacterium]|nr:tRNA glutamyl-Q(34) synthetase GluQRS [Rhodocyclaceae bacterium]